MTGHLDLHPRTLRRNIWRGLLAASNQEIRDGMDFYPGAHGLCRLFAAVHPPTTVAQVAGIYATLSPMNTWDTNVANVLDVLRDWSSARVNTTDANLHKALRIACGMDPLDVLQGRKVRAFYQAIANPEDRSPIPVDRHLICLALGAKITSNQELRALAGDRDLYDRIEAAYQGLGEREGIGNRLAAIAWFVQRRLGDQLPIVEDQTAPVCCRRPMHSHGTRPRRFRCPICAKTRVFARQAKTRPRPSVADVLVDIPVPLSTLSIRDGRPTIHLGKGHSHANSGGWQWLSRFVVLYTTGEKLRSDEHVHHKNGNKLDCRVGNLEVWLAERHGRYHANHQLLYMLRDHVGRWAPSNVPSFDEQIAH